MMKITTLTVVFKRVFNSQRSFSYAGVKSDLSNTESIFSMRKQQLPTMCNVNEILSNLIIQVGSLCVMLLSILLS